MERLDELYIADFGIWQDEKGFRFGTDAVLLYGFMPRACGKTVDLCSGNGAVALMLLAGGKSTSVTAVELQESGCRLARKSAAHNGCEDRLRVVGGDIRKIKEILLAGTFDTVCVNPPYFKKGSGLLPAEESVAIARHELYCTVDDVLAAAEYLLRDGGEFCMVHRVTRKEEILKKIHKYDLHVSEICQVFSTPGKASELFLLRAKKAQEITSVKESTFTVLNEDHSLSHAYKSIYS